MRSLAGRLIIQADLDQKSVIKYGTLTLFMPPKQEQLSIDGKVTNPVIAEVLAEDKSYPYINKGDYLVLNHNVLNNPALQIIGGEGSVKMFVIARDKSILGKLGDKGQLIPLCENILAERIYEKEASSIIITPDAFKKTEENKVKILDVSPETEDIEIGKTAICYQYSDYECTYNVDGERRSAIVVWNKDVVATI